MCTKQWNTGYDHWLLDLPILARRRLYPGLSTMYKIVHRLVYFPSNIFVNRISRTPNTTRLFLYSCPYAHTNIISIRLYRGQYLHGMRYPYLLLQLNFVLLSLMSGCIFKLAQLLLFYVPVHTAKTRVCNSYQKWYDLPCYTEHSFKWYDFHTFLG